VSVEDALLAGRAAAEAKMVDHCTITRASTEQGVLDPVTGLHVEPPPQVIYSGLCKVQRAGLTPATPLAGERRFTVEVVEVHVPMRVTGVDVGDPVTIDSSLFDPALVGRDFTVRGDPAKSYATARRLRCEEVTG
jgi:hypothetical protein